MSDVEENVGADELHEFHRACVMGKGEACDQPLQINHKIKRGLIHGHSRENQGTS